MLLIFKIFREEYTLKTLGDYTRKEIYLKSNIFTELTFYTIHLIPCKRIYQKPYF